MKIEDIVFTGDVDENGFMTLKVASGQFGGTMFTLGKIMFPDEDEPILQYEINYISEPPSDQPTFEQEVGNFIVEMIMKQLEEGKVVYSGGTD